ncbi:MAG TPA: transcriptional regulator, MerR family protein [Fusobacteriaceae bacterium]|nr:transcriptional regulator, MerR family protein [Fusobacteriaceae bacterium]
MSEISKKFGVSCHTFRHYDKEGILKPEMRNEKNGYRYYCVKQFPILEIIIHLRSLKLSIGHIKKHLDKLNYSYTYNLIDEQIKKNRIEIEKFLKTERKLIKEKEHFYELKEAENKINIPFIEKLSENRGIILKVEVTSMEDFHKGIEKINNIMKNNSWKQDNIFGFLIKQEDIEKEKFRGNFMVVFNEVEGFEDIYTLKSGKYVCMYIRQRVHDMNFDYNILFEWIEKKDM